MGGSWTALRKISVDFADIAPWRFMTEVEVNATPEVIFQLLLDDNAWNKWHPEVSDITWLTEKPHRAGSMRTVRFSQWLFMLLLMGSLILTEEFLIWEDNKRIAFRFNKTNRPAFLGYRAGMEDFRLEALPNGKTMFTRIVAVEPSLITSMLGCIIKPTLDGVFQRAANRLAKQYEVHS